MGIFGGLKGIGMMFDGKAGSPIEDFLRKNELFGMRNLHPSQDYAAKGFAPSPGMVGGPMQSVQDEMVRRNLGNAPGGSMPPVDGAGAEAAKARRMRRRGIFNGDDDLQWLPPWFPGGGGIF